MKLKKKHLKAAHLKILRLNQVTNSPHWPFLQSFDGSTVTLTLF